MHSANSGSAVMVNLTDFPGVADALAGKGPGDKVTVTMDLSIEEFTGDTLRGMVSKVVPDGYKMIEEPEEEIEESEELEEDSEPIVAVLAARGEE